MEHVGWKFIISRHWAQSCWVEKKLYVHWGRFGEAQDEEGKRMSLQNLLILSIQITLFLWDYQVAGRANTKCLEVGAGREGRGERKM